MQFNEDKKNTFGMILFVLSIILCGYMLFSPLTQQVMHIDEFFTMTVVNFPVGEILHIASGDYNPPLYYLISKLAVKLLTPYGIDFLPALKLVSVIPYLLILAVSATKLRSEYGWLTAGLFAFSIGVMSEFFKYFITARMYSWALIFLVLAFIYLKDVMSKDDLKSWALFTLFAILGAYTHYYAAIPLAFIYVALLYYFKRFSDNGIKHAAISIVVAIVFYLPWITSLIHQIKAIAVSPWIAPVNSDLIISSLGYFASNGEVAMSILAIIVLIIIGALYYKSSNNGDENERFYLLTGIGAFIATILIGAIFSLFVNPILLLKFLIPSAAIMWLVISIMLNRIENTRLFLFSFALIALLLVSGIGNMLAAESDINGTFDNIVKDDSSIVVLTNPKSMIYFLNLDNRTDLYCINQSYVYGENINLTHEIFDFKEISQDEIRSLALNNTDKDIYLFTWADSNQYGNFTTDSVFKENGLEILKINTTSLIPYEEEYYYY